jgi:leucine dehydrogenase
VIDFEAVDAADLERLLVVRDRGARAVAVVAVHDTTLGPAHGGIRRRTYAGLGAAVADALALAAAMTWKCALAEVPSGGGKVVLLDRPDLDRAAAYRLVGATVASLGGSFRTGPDVGTTPMDLAEVAAETEFVSTGAGGEGDLGLATALGVEAAMGALIEQLGKPWRGLRVLVQGVGSVGAALAQLLAARDVEVLVADVDAGRAAEVAGRLGAKTVAAARALDTPCDVLAPCALGGMLDEAVAATLPAAGVCGAANNQLVGRAADRLAERGVVVVPDFVANAGAVIAGITFAATGVPATPDRIARIGATAATILASAARQGRSPVAVALDSAQERVASARAARHR